MASSLRTVGRMLGGKILVIGQRSVGKTTIVNQLCKMVGKMVLDEEGIREDIRLQTMTESFWFMEETLTDLPSLRRLTIGTADAFILVYSVDDEESFQYVTTLINDVREVKGKDVPLIIVSNKTDIEVPIQRRIMADCIITIDYECKHFEVCALDGKNIQNVFSSLFEHFGQFIVFPEDNEDHENNKNNHQHNDRTLKKKLGTLFRRFLCIPRHH